MAACSHDLVRPSGEVFVTQALPAGTQIEPTELEGPVFADANGRTLYRWPQKNLRNGNAGDPTGSSFCTSVKTTVNAGLMSPYPAGLVLPDLETRPACTAAWPPAIAAGGAKAHYDGIVAFSQTDFTEDLKKINVPVLVMHSEDDQIVPYVAAGPLSAKLLRNGTLKTYKGFPHGMPTTQADTINADLLAFIKS
jgi:pimeloyl-ACP methyl ester carboxylesterase